jgi:carbamoyltransferase
LQPRDLDLVVVVKPEPRAERRAIEEPLRSYDWWAAGGPLSRRALQWLTFRGYKNLKGEIERRRLGRQISSWLYAAGVPANRVVRAHHHRSHAASAFFASGFDRALAVTCDGQGGGVSASVYRCSGASMELVHEVKTPNSMGFFYAMVTRALGFTPARHEGKVTGLAACAPPDPDALALFREIARSIDGSFETPGVYGALRQTTRLTHARGLAPVAAAAQAILEEVVTAYVSHHLAATGETCLALAGGVFANVRLNQKLHQLPGVERVFIFPHMGDGGLGFGGVADLLAELQGQKSRSLKDVYLGPEFAEPDMEGELLRAGIEYKFVPDLERRLGQHLARGKTVGRFAGRMEFGPRALGNRSILLQATDPTVNDWLNKKLRRTEFMPFAPVVLHEDAPVLFPGFAGAEHAAEFMTVTFDCAPALREMSPAVVHKDGTARPQAIREEVNPGYYAILDEYRRLTGLPALINTSFNLHEEPIVMTPADAIRAFVESDLDLLAIGPFLAERKA